MSGDVTKGLEDERAALVAADKADRSPKAKKARSTLSTFAELEGLNIKNVTNVKLNQRNLTPLISERSVEFGDDNSIVDLFLSLSCGPAAQLIVDSVNESLFNNRSSGPLLAASPWMSIARFAAWKSS